MPLTEVVDYLNDCLRHLHPGAHMSLQASLHYKQGVLSATVAGYRLTPYQLPVVRIADGEFIAYRGQCLVKTGRGQILKPEALYAQAWNAHDVLFLDRFLRTFHAIHHLNHIQRPQAWLVVDVHPRHISAVSEQHGRVFEDLLKNLGVAPTQILLRLQGQDLQQDPHVQEAAGNFARRGYRLLAVRPDLQSVDWNRLREMGVRWMTPNRIADEVSLARQIETGARHGIGLWVDEINSPSDLKQAVALGADLVEGQLLENTQGHALVQGRGRAE